jgi:hypothetical protein
LSKDKEALKAQLMNVIKKKPAAKTPGGQQSGVKRESTAIADGGDETYQG